MWNLPPGKPASGQMTGIRAMVACFPRVLMPSCNLPSFQTVWFGMKSPARLVFLLQAAAAAIPLSATAAEPPVPGLVLHVRPDAHPTTSRTGTGPFATLEAARDAIRALKQQGPLPRGGVVVEIHPDAKPLERTFTLGPADSGTAEAPIIYRGDRHAMPCLTRETRLRDFAKVTDPALLARLPEEARGRVWQTSLKAQGIDSVPPVRLGGFGSGRGFRSTPAVRLFAGDRELPLARWPNQGTTTLESVVVADGHQIHGLRGSKTGRFTCGSDRLARWTADPDIVLAGYWFWDWAESRELVKSIDPAKREITLEPPFHTYGYRAGQTFHATNLFSEIDQPGEWYLDRTTLILYVHSLPDWPARAGVADGPPTQAPDGLTLAFEGFPAVVAEKVEHIRLQGLAWHSSAGDGIHLNNCRHVVIEGCRFSRLAGDAIIVNGGSDCGVVSCDIESIGRGGILLQGGDRKTLTPGRHQVTNCHLHHLSCVDPTYTPAVLVTGVGHSLTHNRIHDLPSSAIRVGGNDHVVEFNEVFKVVLESDDQGAVDMWGDPTFRGNVYRYNSWHDIGRNADGSNPKHGRAAIRFDDAISGQLVEHNVFVRCGGGLSGFGAVQIHGGRDQMIRRNLFIACPAAVSFSPWQLDRWKTFVTPKFPSPELDATLYLARYPALGDLTYSANGNRVEANLARSCATFLLRQPPNTQTRDNTVEAGDGQAPQAPSEADYRRIGLDPEQVSRIGLRADTWRQGPACSLTPPPN